MADTLLTGTTLIEDSRVGKKFDNPIKIGETASGDGAEATYGQLWVKNSTPNELYFQDDTGTDYQITGAKTLYKSIPGVAFAGKYADSAYFTSLSTTTGKAIAETAAGDNRMWAAVELPNGAVVTGAIVYGSTTNENWSLIRSELATGAADSTMATAATNTEDTSITDATIDNSTYYYFLTIGSLDENDEIYGARITYTLDMPLN